MLFHLGPNSIPFRLKKRSLKSGSISRVLNQCWFAQQDSFHILFYFKWRLVFFVHFISLQIQTLLFSKQFSKFDYVWMVCCLEAPRTGQFSSEWKMHCAVLTPGTSDSPTTLSVQKEMRANSTRKLRGEIQSVLQQSLVLIVKNSFLSWLLYHVATADVCLNAEILHWIRDFSWYQHAEGVPWQTRCLICVNVYQCQFRVSISGEDHIVILI